MTARTVDLQAIAGGNGVADTERFRLDVLTARELCALPDPDGADEILGPLVVRGYRTVIGGGTGEGKTTLTLAMVAAVVTGGEFLDWRGVQGKALIVDAEQGLKTAKKRLREIGLDDSDAIDYCRVPDGLSLDSDPAQIAAFEGQLEEGGYSVVVLDPLYKLHRGSSNDEREAVDLMRQFDRWREHHRFALILPVHLRKRPQGARFSMDEFHGSGAYTRGAETVIGIQRGEGEGYSRLCWFKDRDGELPATGTSWGLLFDRETGFRRDPKDVEPPIKDKILWQLEDGQLTAERLADALGVSERHVRNKLKELEAEDPPLVESHSSGKFKLWRLAGREGESS